MIDAAALPTPSTYYAPPTTKYGPPSTYAAPSSSASNSVHESLGTTSSRPFASRSPKLTGRRQRELQKGCQGQVQELHMRGTHQSGPIHVERHSAAIYFKCSSSSPSLASLLNGNSGRRPEMRLGGCVASTHTSITQPRLSSG